MAGVIDAARHQQAGCTLHLPQLRRQRSQGRSNLLWPTIGANCDDKPGLLHGRWAMLDHDSGGDWAREVFPSPEQARLGRLLPVGSARRRLAKGVAGPAYDAALRLRGALRGSGRELDRAADAAPVRDVLVLGVYGDDASDLSAAVAELRHSRHRVTVALGAMGEPDPRLAAITVAEGLGGGKFANLNAILTRVRERPEWTLIVDDDVALPPAFLDRMVGAAEALLLDLAQPAQTWASNAPWPVTRRRAGIARSTRFVEIGPVCLLRRPVLEALTPFSEQGMGWGLCLHWAALAADRGWRLGIVDALPVRHERRPTASAYSEREALAAAREFLATNEHIDREAAAEVLERHARLPAPAGGAAQ